MPSRMIRDSILRSETLENLTMGAENTFFRLILVADDLGIFPAHPNLVLSACFPMKRSLAVAQIERWLLELGKELLCFYRVDGKRFGHFITWKKYQRIRSLHSKWPLPTDASMCGHLLTDGVREARSEKREARSKAGGRAVLPDDAFLDELRINPAYRGIDIDRELNKMDAYLLTPRGRGKKKTRGFIVNWLNRIDRPMDYSAGASLMSPRSEDALKRFADREDYHGHD